MKSLDSENLALVLFDMTVHLFIRLCERFFFFAYTSHSSNIVSACLAVPGYHR